MRPERRIIGFVLLHELQVEQREIVHQAIDGIIFPGAIGIGTDKKTTGIIGGNCLPPRPSENLDFLLFITVLRAYKAL